VTPTEESSSLGAPPVPFAPALPIWVSLQVAAATIACVIVAATTPLRPEIALPWPGLPSDIAVVAGMAFWMVFGLVGGLRARLRPGGAVVTFSMPFIVGGTILGGPLAGALMGLVAEFEVREIRTLPWYGTLANHAVSMLAAIGAALIGGPAHSLLDRVLPGQEGLAFFGAAIVTALVFDFLNILLVLPTLAIRGDQSLREAARSPDVALRATAVAEGILAWNMAAGYVLLGWWAPVACVALVLIVWQAHDRGEALRRDTKTGLLNDAGLLPRLDAAIEAARAGRRPSAFLLLDLDRFKHVNDTYLYEAGDEVLTMTARRLLIAVRALDSVARMNRAGDEFGILLDGVPDRETASRLARRVQDRIREPIRLRSVAATVDVDASFGVVMIERGTMLTSAAVFELADVRMLQGKALGSGVVSDGEVDAESLERRKAAGPRRLEAQPVQALDDGSRWAGRNDDRRAADTDERTWAR
jgi:diguanylate cyclase (GGDEF)-like protein